MPHYADGTEAKVGDQVTGKLYNTDGIKAGVITSITPGAESCNAKVQFAVAEQIVDNVMPELPRMAILRASTTEDPPTTRKMTRIVKGEQHGTAGEQFVVFLCEDYCATNELTKVG